MRSIPLSLLFVFLSFPAGAWDHPQFFFQAGEGEHVLTPRLNRVRQTVEVPGLPNLETTQNVIGLEYEYGWTEWLSVGLIESYGQAEQELLTTNKVSGFLDFIGFLKANYRISESMVLRYGTSLSLGSEAEENAQGDDQNLYSGRTDLTPYVGLDYTMGSSVFGGAVSQEILLGDQVTKISDGTEENTKGGNSTRVRVFYEYNFEDNYILGGNYEYRKTSDIENSDGSRNEVITIFGLNLYGVVPLSDKWVFIPEVAHFTSPDDMVGTTRLDDYSLTSITLSFRYAF